MGSTNPTHWKHEMDHSSNLDSYEYGSITAKVRFLTPKQFLAGQGFLSFEETWRRACLSFDFMSGSIGLRFTGLLSGVLGQTSMKSYRPHGEKEQIYT